VAVVWKILAIHSIEMYRQEQQEFVLSILIITPLNIMILLILLVRNYFMLFILLICLITITSPTTRFKRATAIQFVCEISPISTRFETIGLKIVLLGAIIQLGFAIQQIRLVQNQQMNVNRMAMNLEIMF